MLKSGIYDNIENKKKILIRKFYGGELPNKQQKMLLGWAALPQEELMENWELARNKQELFPIEPLH